MKKNRYSKEVAHIISSKSFGNSNTYANLLNYLVECSVNEDVPKEITIATVIFGKPSFDPSQSTLVRVYVYNLRNKLEKYYQNEGADQETVICIPKGSYKVAFTSKKEEISSEINEKLNGISRHKIFLGSLLGVLIFSVFLNFYQWNNKRNNGIGAMNPPALWKDLTESKHPTLLVLGDLFVYQEYDSTLGVTRTIRASQINDNRQYQDLISKDSRKHISTKPLSYTLLIRNSTECVKQLCKVFQFLGKDFSLRTILRFNPKELQDNDIIAVGMAKTLGVVTSYFHNTTIAYHSDTDSFKFTDPVSGQITYYKPIGDPDSYHKDYAIMSKLPGSGKNQIYVFAGLWDTGASQSFKNFTDVELSEQIAKALKSKFGKIPKYYEILIEVSGMDRMELRTKILKMNLIEESNYFK